MDVNGNGQRSRHRLSIGSSRLSSTATLKPTKPIRPSSSSPLYLLVTLLAAALCVALPGAIAAPSSPLAPDPQQLAVSSVRDAPGLPSNGLLSNGIHLGFLPFWSDEGPIELCTALGACAAIWGDYWNVGTSPGSYSFAQADYHIDEIARVVGGDVKGVYAPAVLFSGRMDQWTQAMTTSLVSTVRSINRRGITVWLRFCYEMNGGWMNYGLQPQDYVSVWREVTTAIRAATNETYMFWAPNLWNGPVDDPVQGYTPYWPGEEYVDVTGLSMYWFGPQRSINQVPESGSFRDSLQPFYNLVAGTGSNPLGLQRGYPVVVAESSAPYYFDIPSSSQYYTQQGDTDIQPPLPNLNNYQPSLNEPNPYPRSDDELAVKAIWIAQMTGNVTAQRFPNLRAVTWFNYLKKGNATAEVLADFRFVGGNSTVTSWLRQNFGNQTAYEQGYTGAASSLLRSQFGRSALVAPLFATLFLLFLSSA
ncbi:hypothetical protein JCM10908_004536 [Rhodotorula pacifica]|uniref:uncharacterized protein n=1 Tax=Rhodotorula pacifica TaxID=1495444 RepID=UPI0031810DA0